jgi:pSer/pThr/pTyr-binding forkhead associated (FHA) protein
MTRLIVLQKKSGSAKQINVASLPFVIGRAGTADLVLDNQLVSRSHAVLETVNEALTLRDLHSHNGTYVNDTRIDAVALRNGDEIRIGDYQIRYLATKGQLLDADALRLVTEPGKLADLDLQRISKA